MVDDDQALLHALSRLIEAAGFRVLSFDRPSALLASAIPRANACMVVDIDLPEMNGSELCSALAASGRGRPAILITGRNDYATQRLIEKAHAVASLFKPFDERTLFDAIARALTLLGNRIEGMIRESLSAAAITIAVCVAAGAWGLFLSTVARAIGIVDHLLKRSLSKPPSARLRACKWTPWRVCALATHLCTGLDCADALQPAATPAELLRARRPPWSR